ncbi:ATP-binding cassette domain-containing protein [Escherichia coli]|uniref:ATP-binding cassette domain-containing protein n=1 Tax=Escherichia coli TaxID=562 RepID=UPI0024E16E2E|nr:ATP-binding cassette domain-containing protein [Escherichia coli]
MTGENGSGKTTIAKILPGNITTEENTIKINGLQQEKAKSPFVNIIYTPPINILRLLSSFLYLLSKFSFLY